MTTAKKDLEHKLVKMMNPEYPWIVSVLASRCNLPYPTTWKAFKRLKDQKLIETFIPDNEITRKVGNKCRLTEKGITLRTKLLNNEST